MRPKTIRIDNQEINIARTVDAVGLFCPMPVVKLKLEMENVETNQVVELLADDPGVLEDLPVWCRETDNRLISLEKDRDSIFVAYIEKLKG